MGTRKYLSGRALVTYGLVFGVSLALAGCGADSPSGNESAKAGASSGDTATAEPVPQTRTDQKRRSDGQVELRQAAQTRAANAANELPPLRVEPPILDFGFIPPEVDSAGTVKLVNISDKPLRILAVQPTCKCTTLKDLAGTEIPVGGSVDLEASLDGGPNPGPKTAAVKVLVENYPRPIEVDLKAEISLPIRAIPAYVNAVRDQNKVGRIVIESIDGEPFTICSIHGKKPNLMNFDPETDPPTNKHIYNYDLSEFELPYPRYLVVATDNPKTPVVDIYLRHESTMPGLNRNLRVAGGFRHPFGRIDKGGSMEMEIGFITPDDPIATVVSTSPDARVDLIGTRTEQVKDDVVSFQKIRITPASDHEGVLYFPATFLTSRGQSVDVPLFGIVVPAGEACAAEWRAEVESKPAPEDSAG